MASVFPKFDIYLEILRTSVHQVGMSKWLCSHIIKYNRTANLYLTVHRVILLNL